LWKKVKEFLQPFENLVKIGWFRFLDSLIFLSRTSAQRGNGLGELVAGPDHQRLFMIGSRP
jgi:hypothetical protein